LIIEENKNLNDLLNQKDKSILETHAKNRELEEQILLKDRIINEINLESEDSQSIQQMNSNLKNEV
jgi:hypothetical protein